MADFKYLDTETDIKAAIDTINETRAYTVLDVETTGINAHTCDLVDIQLLVKDDLVCMFPAKFCKLLSGLKPDMLLVGQNIKYDFSVLARYDVYLMDRPFHDTMLLDHLVDENESHSLGSIAERAGIGSDWKDFWDKYKSYLDAPFEERLEYACNDIIITDGCYKWLLASL